MTACPPHHWLLESPHESPIVRGVCKKCGAERDFPASSYMEPNSTSWRNPNPPGIPQPRQIAAVYGRREGPRERRWGHGRH